MLLLSSFYSSSQAEIAQWPEQSHAKTYAVDTESLTRIYTTPTLIWLTNQQLNTQAHDALDFISSSSQHGLDPNDYHLTELNQLTPPYDTFSAQQFDVLLTDGLVKLIHDISVGRLQANIADPQWFIPQQSIDAVEFLQQALFAPHFKARLNSLSPSTSEYHSLITALSRYQSYVDRGGWSTIPPMPLTHLGERQKNIPHIRSRLSFEYKELVLSSPKTAQFYDPFLEQAVRSYQENHGLKVDGIIGSETWNSMNVSAQERLQQIKVALERHRWMPNDLGQRYLIINLANYQLRAINNNHEALKMRVIVGRKSRPTPSFFSQMNHLVFNPYWNVPKKLAKLDLLPKQQDNFNYFYLKNIRVFTHKDGKKIEHDPYSIDWESVNRYNFPYTFRQDPGKHNALGKLKFMFPNKWSIYLHDTSHPELFSETNRSLSSGCIRVEDPIALAHFSLSTPTAEKTVTDLLDSKENSGLKLSNPLSLYAVYFTVWATGNNVKFSPDIYLRDKHISDLL